MDYRRFSVLVAAVAVAAAVFANPNSASPTPLLFVLAGQSNMVGEGFPIPVEHPNDHVMRVALDNTEVPAKDPLGERGDPTAPGSGFGPGMPFAWFLEHRNHAQQIVLLMCAAGGTSIAQWQKGQELFDTCVGRTRAAKRYGRLSGLLFFQGEADAMNPDDAATWAGKFVAMVRAFRGALGNIPVVYGQIGTIADPRFYAQERVRAQQASVRLPRAAMITTTDLPMNGSRVHFTNEAYAAVGQRFGRAWLSLSRPKRGSQDH